jgi:hypothetical protein
MQVGNRQLGWSAAAAAAIAIGAAALLGTPGAVAASAPQQWRYVAEDFYVVGPDFAAATVGSATGVRTAPLGHVTFAATDDHVVIDVDDVGSAATDGRVRVVVATRDLVQHRCIPNRTPVRFDGIQPGAQVSVTVLDATYGALDGCTLGGGTTGTLTVQP